MEIGIRQLSLIFFGEGGIGGLVWCVSELIYCMHGVWFFGNIRAIDQQVITFKIFHSLLQSILHCSVPDKVLYHNFRWIKIRSTTGRDWSMSSIARFDLGRAAASGTLPLPLPVLSHKLLFFKQHISMKQTNVSLVLYVTFCLPFSFIFQFKLLSPLVNLCLCLCLRPQ